MSKYAEEMDRKRHQLFLRWIENFNSFRYKNEIVENSDLFSLLFFKNWDDWAAERSTRWRTEYKITQEDMDYLHNNVPYITNRERQAILYSEYPKLAYICGKCCPISDSKASLKENEENNEKELLRSRDLYTKDEVIEVIKRVQTDASKNRGMFLPKAEEYLK